MTHYDHVIVGGGVAGTTAAEAIRKLDANATIAIISAEPHPLYSRVLLPNYIKGAIRREQVFLRKVDHYEKLHIDFLSHRRAIGVHAGSHEVALDDGNTLSYGKLLWATGGKARKAQVRGADLPGVFYFRTLAHADAIFEALGQGADHEAVIVGGGFIALEFPPFFRSHNIPTHLILRSPRYWHSVLDQDSSGIIEDVLKENGVVIHYLEECEELLGTGALRGVRLTSGKELHATFAGVGVGLIFETGPLCAAGAAGDHHIEVDEYLQTSLPDVYAAGDVTEFMDTTAGRRRHVGNWMNAAEQGRVAGMNMAGAGVPFHLVSQYATKIWNCVISFIGDVSGVPGTTTMCRGDRATRARAQYFIRDGRLVGATLLGMPQSRGPVSEMIKRGEPFDLNSL